MGGNILFLGSVTLADGVPDTGVIRLHEPAEQRESRMKVGLDIMQ